MYSVHTDNERKASADAVEEGGMQNTYFGESNFVNARLSCCISNVYLDIWVFIADDK